MKNGPDAPLNHKNEWEESPVLIFTSKSCVLSDTQCSILNDYFESFIEGYFNIFIEAAVEHSKPLRLHLIRASLTLEPSIYTQLLDMGYPQPSSDSPTFEQHQLIREYLVAFNQLCLGEVDINHQLYTWIFELSNQIKSSTKRQLVSNYLRNMIECRFDFNGIDQDEFVVHARKFEHQLKCSCTDDALETDIPEATGAPEIAGVQATHRARRDCLS